MQQRLTPGTALLLAVPPLMWASNAVIGRLIREMVSPLTLNFIRWLLAFILLLPLAVHVLRPGSPVWPNWKRFALLGLLGVGLYNAFQYLALQTSTPINVTLVGSGQPIWMLATGALFFGARVTRHELVAAALSMLGVLLVLCRGDWHALMSLRLVAGDLYMVLATIAWAFYSWMIARPGASDALLRQSWATFLMAQMVFGVAWSGGLSGGEWLTGHGFLHPSWPLAAALAFIALGPALLAFRCWDLGVRRAGPKAAGFFVNLTPLFAALLSAIFLREPPRWYHAAAFALIVGGIVASSIKRPAAPSTAQ
ncbi:MAG: DMT family transporter [Gammaproteobacteria bacterium]|nr:DMT family transporter [Gammaproteobacteria bacterium]MBU2287477.1 DMT family transporter [Gammaproteobacteria bacterium]